MNTATKLNVILNGAPAYASLWDAMGGFRAVTESPAAVLAKAIAAAKPAKDGEADHSTAIDSMAVALAGLGAASVADVISGEATLPPAGDAGYYVSMIGVRGIETGETDESGKAVKKNGISGLAIYPAYSAATVMGTDSGAAWIADLIAKEAGLIAFRGLRAIETVGELTAGAQDMPVALSDFTDRAQSTGSESFGLFHAVWLGVRHGLASNPGTAALVEALPTKKAEILTSIRSKPYAEALFPELERHGFFAFIGKLLVSMAPVMAEQAANAGEDFPHDIAAAQRWLDGRESLDLRPRSKSDQVDLSTIDLSAFNVA